MSQAVMPKQPTKDIKQAATLHIPLYLWLTVPVAIGAFIVALTGILNPAVYSNSDSLAAQGQGQDVVTLLLALPVLILSAWYTAHNSLRGRIIWLGALIYFAYTYTISAFQVKFNPLFLLYVIILGSAFYGLVLGFMSIKPDSIRISKKTPVRAISLIAGFIAIAYYGLWLSDVLPAVLNNTVPAAITTDNIATSGVHVLDMGFYLPLLLAGAMLLWQRRPMGYVITGAALMLGVIMGIAVIAMVINLSIWGLADSLAPIVIFAVTTLLTGGALFALLRSTDR